MRRREFIILLGGSMATWPLAARAQQPIPLIGVLSSRTLDMNGPLVDAFRRGLAENGYIEGRNVTVEYRVADGDYGRLSALADEFS
jgi:putative ABC transport system substrate-binding protein